MYRDGYERHVLRDRMVTRLIEGSEIQAIDLLDKNDALSWL